MGFAPRWGGQAATNALLVENGLKLAVPAAGAATGDSSYRLTLSFDTEDSKK